MKLTSALARQRAMNPMTQEGLQFRGSMGDRSTGLVRPGAETPPPGPRAQQQGPTPNALAPSPTSPRPPRPPGAPLVGARAAGPTIQANPNPAWRPQDPNAAPPPRPAAPGYQVTPQAPGAAGSSHRQVTTQGDLTGSMGWRSTSLGSPVMQATPGARAGLGNQNLGGPSVAAAGGGTLQMDMERATQLANQIAQMGYGTGGSAPWAASLSVQPPPQSNDRPGGSGGNTSWGRQSNEMTQQPGDQVPDVGSSSRAATRVVRDADEDPAARESSVEKMRRGEPLDQRDLDNIHVWLSEHGNKYGVFEGKLVRYYKKHGLWTWEVVGDPNDPSSWSEDLSKAVGASTDNYGQGDAPNWNRTTYDNEALARTLGVTPDVLDQMGADGYVFVTRTDADGNKTTYIQGPDGSLQPAGDSDILRGYIGSAESQSIQDLLNQGPPEFDQAALEELITSTRRSSNMANAQSVAAAMQMGANAGSGPEAMQGLIADAGHRQAVQVAAMEAQQRFAGQVQQYQAELSWVQNKLAALQQQAAQSQDMRVRQMALDAQKELMAYQAQIQSEMAQAQMSAENAAKLGQVIGMIGGAIVGGVATGLSGGAAAPLLPALTAAGGAAGGYIGGRYG